MVQNQNIFLIIALNRDFIDYQMFKDFKLGIQVNIAGENLNNVLDDVDSNYEHVSVRTW